MDMMEDELKACITDAVKTLDNYRSFGPMVEKGISAFERINECITDPSDEEKAEAKDLINQLQEEIGPYQGYVPTVADALEKLKEWSEGST